MQGALRTRIQHVESERDERTRQREEVIAQLAQAQSDLNAARVERDKNRAALSDCVRQRDEAIKEHAECKEKLRGVRERLAEESKRSESSWSQRNLAIAERDLARSELAAERAKPAPEPKELLAELAALRRQDERQRDQIAHMEKHLQAAQGAQFDAEILADELQQTVASLGRVIHLGKLQRENRNRRAIARVE